MTNPWEMNWGAQQPPQPAQQGGGMPWEMSWQPAQPAQPSVGADVAKSAGVGVAKGAISLAGLPGDLSELGAQGLDKAVTAIGGLFGQDWSRATRSPEARQLGQAPEGSAAIQRGVEGYTGEFYKPQTTAGKYAQTVGEFAPAVAAGPGGLARKAITTVASGLGSEAAGQALEGSPLEPYARVVGGVAGGLAPSAAQRLVTPFPASPARQAAVDVLRREGVTDLTAGDVTGSARLRNFEQQMGGQRGAAMAEAKAEQFTAAALRRAGIQGETRATPEVVDRAFTRIGQMFDDVAARNNVALDRNLANELVRVQREYNHLVAPSSRVPAVEATIRDIGDIAAANGGILDGAAYQAMRSRLDKAARGTVHSDPQLSDALFGIRNGLDDAMARSMTSAADRAMLRDARSQYRNMLVIERAATGAGSDAAMGLISPSALRNATVAQNRRAYARGGGDFSELARAGEAVLKPLPNSGTAGRTAAQNMGMGIPGMIGAGIGTTVGTAVGHPVLGGMVGAAAGGALPKVAGNLVHTGPVRSILGNQLLAENLTPWEQLALSFQTAGPGLLPSRLQSGQ